MRKTCAETAYKLRDGCGRFGLFTHSPKLAQPYSGISQQFVHYLYPAKQQFVPLSFRLYLPLLVGWFYPSSTGPIVTTTN